MSDVNGLTKSKRFNFYFIYVPVCRRIYRKIYTVLRSDVEPHMVVIASELSEICRQADGNGKGIPEFRFRVINRLKKLRIRRGVKEKQYQENAN